MQTIATEFNLSETVFVLKPAKTGGDRAAIARINRRSDLWGNLLSSW